jgi:hypothetical protein
MLWLWFVFNKENITSVGKSKPWQQNCSALKPKSYHEQWYNALKILKRRANVKTNFDFTKCAAPPVGRFSDYGSMIEHIRKKAYNNWIVYEATDTMVW